MPKEHMQLIAKSQMLMLVDRGTVSNKDTGLEYSILNDENGTPYVKSKKSGRKFRLDWQHIVHLAIENGVDETPAIMSGIPH